MAPETFEYHDNEVVIIVIPPSGPSPPISSGSFTVTAFKISSGQDPDNRNKIGDVHTFIASTVQDQKFVFTCGRHGTSDVASFWNTNIPPNNNTFGHTAGDLNFAFLGTLVLAFWTPQGRRTVTFLDMGFAQGHSGSTNNWWFGGKNCKHEGDNKVTCTGTDQNGNSVKFTFLRGDNFGLVVNVVHITDMEFS
ncbi:hypothetical protein L218DRAFT_1007178 [Marasmius fiardii PR-910]|nr:hypothetical protein L218DRAFT_1007178 [Marasmius fiardii PR-910]